MYHAFEKYINTHKLLQEKQKVLLACSGGADSMCLAALMQLWSQKHKGKLAVCHINHNLRGAESERDAEFVHTYCKQHGLECEIVNVQVKEFAKDEHLSIEQAARELRYQALYKTRAKLGCELIATAHNKNDQVETFLLNMLRGAGINGLKGMLPKQGTLIRPLLDTERVAIEFFCEQQGLSYCHDSSNDSHEYLRNRIRHELLPLLEQYNPNLLTSLARNMDNIRTDVDYLNKQAQELSDRLLVNKKTNISIPLTDFTQLSQSMATRILLLAIEKLVSTTQGISNNQLKQIYSLAHESRGSKLLKLPHGLIVRKTYDLLIVDTQTNSTTHKLPHLQIERPGRYVFGKTELLVSEQISPTLPKSSASKLYIPSDIIHQGLLIRSREVGDWFELSDGGRKSVKNFFIDQKIAKETRDCVPLVYLADKLVCILGYRLIKADFESANHKYLVIEYINN